MSDEKAHTYFMGCMLAGVKNKYCIPMDLYQNIAILYCNELTLT